MLSGSGPSGLMYIMRAAALENERGESPDLTSLYGPGTPRQARRRFIAVSILSVLWVPGVILGGLVAVIGVAMALLGLVLALSTQFEAAWIGSPVRPWTRLAMPVAIAGFVVTFLTA